MASAENPDRMKAVSSRAARPAPPAKSSGKSVTRSPAAPQSTPAGSRQRIRLETRAQLLERLTNPQITLHEASVILRVCPATVRNYCNAGYLPHERTTGGQRRFRLNDVLTFAREREAERRK